MPEAVVARQDSTIERAIKNRAHEEPSGLELSFAAEITGSI